MEIKYQTRLVAFIDVMGFKELLGDLPTLNRYFSKCKEHLGHKSDAFKKYHPGSDFQMIMISDSIILSILLNGKNDLKQTANFVSSVGLLQYVLAVNSQIWTRGAISVGDVCIKTTENLLVGQGYIDALNLEPVADYPRVIVDPKVATYLKLAPIDFIKDSNALTYEGKLLPPSKGSRMGRTEFPFDAIQVDWFKYAFLRKDPLERFFDDLKKRMGISHNLFLKGRKLARYLREAYDTESQIGRKEARMNAIDKQLTELGF